MKVFYLIFIFINIVFSQELNLYLQTKSDTNEKIVELDIELVENNISGTYQYKDDNNSKREIRGVRKNKYYLIEEFDYNQTKTADIELIKINPFTFNGKRVEIDTKKEENLILFKDIYLENSIGEEYEKYLVTFTDTNNSKIVVFSLIDSNSTNVDKIANFFLEKLGFNYKNIDSIYKLKYYDIEKNDYEFENESPINFKVVYEEILDVHLINENIMSYYLIKNNKENNQTQKEFTSLNLSTIKEFALDGVLVKSYKDIIKKYLSSSKNNINIDDYNDSSKVVFSNHEVIINSDKGQIYIPYYEILDINNSLLKMKFAFDK